MITDVEAMASDFDVRGNAFAKVDRGQNREITALERVDPEDVEVVLDREGNILHYRSSTFPLRCYRPFGRNGVMSEQTGTWYPSVDDLPQGETSATELLHVANFASSSHHGTPMWIGINGAQGRPAHDECMLKTGCRASVSVSPAAYEVICDETNNTPRDVEERRQNARVALAIEALSVPKPVLEQRPYLLLKGAPREGLTVTTVTSLQDFAERFPSVAPEQQHAVDYMFARDLFPRGLDVIHGPDQIARPSDG